VTADVRLSYSEAIEVSGSSFLQGQAKALNTQENATNITNVVSSDQMSRFPDINAAESTQRLPAVSLLRDQGEGRYVLVRGTEPRLNSTTVNGERLTATEGGNRNVPLDTIPADILESIAVSKTLTPDMDGDSIGGAVDLVTKRAGLKSSTQASIAGGWADISQDYIGAASFTLGRRFNEGRTGLMFALSGNKSNKASDDQEPEYDDQNLIDMQLRDYTLTRERYAANVSFDQQLSGGSELYFRGLWDNYKDDEQRRAMDNVVEDNELARILRDRTQESDIYSLTAGGNFVAGETVINFRVAWNKGQERTPNQVTSEFKQEDVEFNPNVSPGSIDPDNIRANPANEDYSQYVFDKIETEDRGGTDQDWIGALDVTRGFYKDTGLSGLWKFGVKARLKHATQDYTDFEWSAEDDLPLTDYLEDWKPATSFINGFTSYDIGRFQNPGAMRELLKSGLLESERLLEEDLNDYTIDEDTYAGYGYNRYRSNLNSWRVAVARTPATLPGLRAVVGLRDRPDPGDGEQELQRVAAAGDDAVPPGGAGQPARRGHALVRAAQLRGYGPVAEHQPRGPRDLAGKPRPQPHHGVELRPAVRAVPGVGRAHLRRGVLQDAHRQHLSLDVRGGRRRRDLRRGDAGERRERHAVRRRGRLPEPVEQRVRDLLQLHVGGLDRALHHP
jgi:TonB-dependent receptor